MIFIKEQDVSIHYLTCRVVHEKNTKRSYISRKKYASLYSLKCYRIPSNSLWERCAPKLSAQSHSKQGVLPFTSEPCRKNWRLRRLAVTHGAVFPQEPTRRAKDALICRHISNFKANTRVPSPSNVIIFAAEVTESTPYSTILNLRPGYKAICRSQELGACVINNTRWCKHSRNPRVDNKKTIPGSQ